MAFQTTIGSRLGAGVIGEFYVDSPRRVQPYVLNSVSYLNNIFGRCFSKVSEGIAQCGNPSGTAIFAGFLVNPKEHVLWGTTTGTLESSLTLPNYTQASLCTEGTIFVSLPAACAIGDKVVYDNTTGALTTIAPTANLPTGKSFAYAVVDYFTPDASGTNLAVVTITPTFTIPVPA